MKADLGTADILLDVLRRSLNAYGARSGIKPLVWRVDRMSYELTGQVESDVAPDDARARVEAWGDLLCLGPRRTDRGAVERVGAMDELPVVVWGVVDRAAWDATTYPGNSRTSVEASTDTIREVPGPSEDTITGQEER